MWGICLWRNLDGIVRNRATRWRFSWLHAACVGSQRCGNQSNRAGFIIKGRGSPWRLRPNHGPVPVIVQIVPIGAEMFLTERFILSKTGVYEFGCVVDPVDTDASTDTIETSEKVFNIDKFGSFQHPSRGSSGPDGIRNLSSLTHTLTVHPHRSRDVLNVRFRRKGKRKECLAFPARSSVMQAERVRSQLRGRRLVGCSFGEGLEIAPETLPPIVPSSRLPFGRGDPLTVGCPARFSRL